VRFALGLEMLKNLFARKPNRYSVKAKAKFVETLYFSGYVKRGDQVFTDAKTDLRKLVFHVFTYLFQGVKYELKLSDDNEQCLFDAQLTYDIFIDPDVPIACWFNKQALKGYLWEEDSKD